ncbi:MAG: hypothetical protein V3S89_01945 [Desulfobacterales bacterium]
MEETDVAEETTESFEEKKLLARKAKAAGETPAEDPVEGLPKGKIGDIEISRIICGSNLFWGAAHSRELKYVSRLLRSYFTKDKIFETLQLCEENGINTNIGDAGMVESYREERGGSMQSIAQVDPDNYRHRPDGAVVTTTDDIHRIIDQTAERGAVGILIIGVRADRYVKANRLDLIEEFITYGKKAGLITGVGGHDKRVPEACEKAGIDTDFYFKTIHHDGYYSALPKEKREPFLVDSYGPGDHDCIWEQYPEETIEIMKTVKKPWIGFKVLAAGALDPRDGFAFAFRNGADYACVGMFDWQVREDALIAKEILATSEVSDRPRPWV